jgi:flagellar assembly protein FliH
MSLDAKIIHAGHIDASRVASYPYAFASAVPTIEEMLPETGTDEPLGAAYQETAEEKQFRIDSVEQVISEKFARNERAIEKRLAEVEEVISKKIAAADQKAAQAEERAAQAEARGLQAEEKVAQAEQQVAEINRKGFEEGFAQGENEGRETGEREFKAHLDRLEESLAALSDAVSLLRSVTDDEALALATVMADYLAGQHIDSTAYTAGPLLRSILDAHPLPLPDSAAPGEPVVTIFMHPKDLDQAKAGIAKEHPGTRLLPDAALGRGGIRLETADAVIDSTFERRRESLSRLIGRLKEEGRI